MGKRWLGPKHAYKVSINPLNLTTDISEVRLCIRCERGSDIESFMVEGLETQVCAGCRHEMAVRHRGALATPTA